MKKEYAKPEIYSEKLYIDILRAQCGSANNTSVGMQPFMGCIPNTPCGRTEEVNYVL